MAKNNKLTVAIDVELADGFAAGMGDGGYLIVQRDEYNKRHSVFVTVEDMAAMIANDRERGGPARVVMDA